MERRHDIDWLRVIAIILVLYFHTAMIFTAEWGWHIKNQETSYLWLEFNFWLSQFRMPLLFFISGYGSFLALRNRKPLQYAKERHNRLMIPLVFAMFVVVPPQIYFERIFNGENFSSFANFYPTVLELVPYPKGNFSWHHMWFVLYLFFYSLVGLPLFLWLKSNGAQKASALITKYGIGSLALIVLPTVIMGVSITLRSPRTNDFIHDWAWHSYWFSFFLMGFVVGVFPKIWDIIEKNRRNLLGLALASIVFINFQRWNGLEPWDAETPNSLLVYISLSMRSFNTWMWLLAAAGYAKKYLNKRHKVLDYANQAIYPFYILHQTIIIIIGYYVVTKVQEGIFAKYLFISTLSFIGSLAIYEYLIRPFKLTRILFGVKSIKKGKQKDFNVLENRAEYKSA
jgi:peptidoglycan/LPS O-acetylase OafA/YrhL